MLTFSSYLTERYKNFFGVESKEDRVKYADQVWDILQKSYAPIGGIKGNGFNTKEDMIAQIPLWKIFVRGDKVIAVVMYKDKSGRKTVALGTDGSEEGKKVIADIYKHGLKISYGEKSGPALAYIVKVVGHEYLRNFLLTPAETEKLTGEKCIPVDIFGYENLDVADKRTYDKFPELRNFFYVRELGGEWHMKITMGTPGLPIFK